MRNIIDGCATCGEIEPYDNTDPFWCKCHDFKMKKIDDTVINRVDAFIKSRKAKLFCSACGAEADVTEFNVAYPSGDTSKAYLCDECFNEDMEIDDE